MNDLEVLERGLHQGDLVNLPRGLVAFAEGPCGLTLSRRMREIMALSERPGIRTVAVRAGARGGKTSRLLATKALHAALTVPAPMLGSGEVPVALIVGPDLKLARQALSFVSGYCQLPELRRRVLDETKDQIELQRPDGRRARVEVLAASARGRATRGRTLLFAGLDEACFFRDQETGAINDTEIYDSVMPRLVPGAQAWVVSTPWVAHVGLLEQLIDGEHPTVYAATASTRELNPAWDPDGSIEAAERHRDPDKARREIDAVPTAGGAIHFFDGDLIDACTDPALQLPRVPLPREYVAAGGDLGFRSDSSALAIVHAASDAIRLGELIEVRPELGRPLRPSEVVLSFGRTMLAHGGLAYLVADQHYQETVTEHLADCGLGFVPAPLDVSEPYVKARALMREGRVKLPKHDRLIAQLRSVQWRANPGGSVSIILPRAKTGGHCDLVSALMLALWQAATVEIPEPAPAMGTPAYWRAEEEKMVRDLERQVRREKQEAW